MINLLNPFDKKEIKAARRNTVWVRYMFLLLAALIAVNIILGATYYMINTDNISLRDKIIENNTTSDGSDIGKTKKEADNFRNNLKISKTLLDNETVYSELIIKIASSIPDGCIIKSLTLNKDSVGKPQSMNFNCRLTSKNRESGQLLKNIKKELEDSPAFENVSIISSNEEIGPGMDAYPISVTMSVTLTKSTVAPNVVGGIAP